MDQHSTVRVNGFVQESIVDGPGLRFVIFTQGCPHNCHGCHNPDTHDFLGGYLVSAEEIIRQIAEHPLLAGVTFSGGEPFLQARVLSLIAAAVHAMQKNVVTYTGYVFEELLVMAAKDKNIQTLLDSTDILVDGPYVDSLRALDLPFRGSSNQRLLNLQERDLLRGKSLSGVKL